MTIGKVMDWTEARVDAIKAREEEEEEDEEREKDKERAPSVAVHAAPKSEVSKPGVQHPSTHRPKDTTISLPTPNSPGCHPNIQSPSSPSSPSPPPTHVQRSATRKHRLPPTRETFQLTTQSTNVHPSSTFHAEHFPSSASSGTYPETPILIGAGAKRRHAVMMMLDSSSAPISIGDPSSVVSSPGPGSMNAGTYMGSTGTNIGKRRTRSSRNLGQIQSQNQNINVIQVSPEPMDIEEDGRERKRVARR